MAFTSITPLSPYTFVGATTGTRGAGGLVPTPQPGDQGKLLQGDGTWSSNLSFDSSGSATFEHAISETSQNSFSTSLSSGVNINVSAGTVILGSGVGTITGFNFINIPETVNRATTVSLVLLNTGSYTYSKTCTVNGTSVPAGIRWAAGASPIATTGTDVLSFGIIRDSSNNIRVFGFSNTNLF